MSTEPVAVKLSNHPDAYGFIYGNLRQAGELHSINVMPPKGEWRGQFELEGYEPDETDWKLYIDGEEVARVRKRSDIAEMLGQVLLKG